MFTPDRIAIEKINETPVVERRSSRDSFADRPLNTPRHALHREVEFD
jgi:hypothetical protein